MSFLYFRYVDSHWKMIINVRENRVCDQQQATDIAQGLGLGVRGPLLYCHLAAKICMNYTQSVS